MKDFPPASFSWACEVEATHSARVTALLRAKDIPVVPLPQWQWRSEGVSECRSEGVTQRPASSLLFTQHSLTVPLPHSLTPSLPAECFKHITRVFHVPHACADLSSLHHSLTLRALIESDAVFKVQASPKNLERLVAEVLIADSDEDGNPRPHKVSPQNIHPGTHTHIIQVVYSAHESLFRWGIVSAQDAVSECMTSEALQCAVDASREALRVSEVGTPASRAFFKMQEVFELCFPKWGWDKELASLQKEHCVSGGVSGGLLAVDVGASPGGWTQYLSPHCRSVLAIDPGQLLASVATMPGVIHAPYLAEAPETRAALEELTQSTGEHPAAINICVCDVNIEPHVAAEILVDCVLPFMSTARGREGVKECGGFVILTLKLPRNPSEKRIESSFRIACNILAGNETLSPEGHKLRESRRQSRGGAVRSGESGEVATPRCWDFRLVHLGANSRNERTLVCRIGGR